MLLRNEECIRSNATRPKSKMAQASISLVAPGAAAVNTKSKLPKPKLETSKNIYTFNHYIHYIPARTNGSKTHRAHLPHRTRTSITIPRLCATTAPCMARLNEPPAAPAPITTSTTSITTATASGAAESAEARKCSSKPQKPSQPPIIKLSACPFLPLNHKHTPCAPNPGPNPRAHPLTLTK